MKRITLEIHYANKKTELRQFKDGKYIIGRDTGTIPLRDNIVSGRHGELAVSASGVVYTDQGSTNGTFTSDGVKLAGPINMTVGTELRLGDSKIILKAIHQPSTATVMQSSVPPKKREVAKTMLGQPAPNMADIAAMAKTRVATPSRPAPVSIPAPITPPSSTKAKPATPSKIPSSNSKTMLGQPMPDMGAVAAAAAAKSTPSGAPTPLYGSPSDVAAANVPSTSKTSLGQPKPSTPPAVVASRVEDNSKTSLGQPKPSTPPALIASKVAPERATDPGPNSTTDSSLAESDTTTSEAPPEEESNKHSASTTDDTAANEEGYSYNLDIGTLINSPMKDSQWLMKCLVMGLLTIIPIAGALNLAGWVIACYKNRKEGKEEIPEAKLSYISDGLKLFLAYLPAVGAMIAVNIVLGVVTWLLPFLFFIAPIVNLALGLYLFVFGPAIMYLTIEKEMTWTSIRFNELIAFAKRNTSAYTSLVVAFLIASVVAGAGGIVVIGSLLTVPFSAVMQAVILSDIK